MHPEQRLSREHVASVLWGDRPEANARQSLRQCILSLRHDLGAAVSAVLVIDVDRIGLNVQHVTVDAAEFKRLAQSTVDSDLVRAAELYRGEFLSDLILEGSFDAWARKTRSELDNLAAEVFQSCARLADAREDAKLALAAVERLTVVEGSIEYAGPRFAINVDLVDTADRLQVWANRLEWNTEDQATARDELATRIANELKIGATVAEGARTAQDHAAEPDVDALLTQGLAIHYRGISRENYADELALFEEALRREPDLQSAALAVAMALTTGVLNTLSDNPDADLDRADDLLDRAMQMDPHSFRVYLWKGLAYKARHDFQPAYEFLSKAIDINPSATYAHAHLGDVLVKLGHAQAGLDHINYALRLSPKDPFAASFYISAADAELELHHDEAAIDWLQRAVASQPRNPSSYKYLAAAYALLGNKAEAARYWDEFRRLSVTPGLDRVVARVKSVLATSVPGAPSRLIQGLALAAAS